MPRCRPGGIEMRSHLPEFVDQSVEDAVELGVHRVGIGSETTECSDAFTQPQGSSVWPTSGSRRNGCGSAAKRRGESGADRLDQPRWASKVTN